jgi:hypothetical protein
MAAPRWLLLLHQIPSKPDYLRVKIWRRLHRLGAVPLQGALWVLPRDEERNQGLERLLAEIVAGGGDAALVEANFLKGLRDSQVEGLFNRARNAEYRVLAGELREAARLFKKKMDGEVRTRVRAELLRLRGRFHEIEKIDFFHGSARETAHGLLIQLEDKLVGTPAPKPKQKPQKYRGRTWVTRKDIQVDRMASAWMIRRFIDPAAKFKWVPKGYRPKKGEIGYDLPGAEFVHLGDRSTFEVLVERTGQNDRALDAIAQIVHDIDIKDEMYQRPETAGVASLVAGIALTSADDDERLTRAGGAFDQLYEAFSRRR